MNVLEFGLDLEKLDQGVCTYNNLDSATQYCICDLFRNHSPIPISEEYDEPEYRHALETKDPYMTFVFLSEWDMMLKFARGKHKLKPSGFKDTW